MKKLIALSILSTALAGCAAPYAPEEFFFGELGVERGMVESVREVPLDLHGFREAVEHSINPQTAAQLVIRLDSGRAITLRGAQRFEPGQRVRIMAGHIERE